MRLLAVTMFAFCSVSMGQELLTEIPERVEAIGSYAQRGYDFDHHADDARITRLMQSADRIASAMSLVRKKPLGLNLEKPESYKEFLNLSQALINGELDYEYQRRVEWDELPFSGSVIATTPVVPEHCYALWPINGEYVKSTFQVKDQFPQGNGTSAYLVEMKTRLFRDLSFVTSGTVGTIPFDSVTSTTVFDREIEKKFLVISDSRPVERILAYNMGEIQQYGELMPVMYEITPEFLSQVYDQIPLTDRRPLPGDRSQMRALKNRKWTVGKYQRQAEFVGLRNGRVSLRLDGNRIAKIDFEKFSEKDQIFVRQYLHAKRAVEANGEVMLGGSMDKRIPRGASVKGLSGYRKQVVDGVFFQTKSKS